MANSILGRTNTLFDSAGDNHVYNKASDIRDPADLYAKSMSLPT